MALRHEQRLPLRRRDLDALGHVNHAVYHELLEEVRAGLFTSAALGMTIDHFVLAHVDLEYRREARLADGHVLGEVTVTGAGRSSVRLHNRLLLPDGTVAVEGNAVLVAWDPERRAARPLTDAERSALGEP